MRHLETPEEAVAWLAQHVTGSLQVDNRKVKNGDGFIAWPGASHDGRNFVKAAVANGAVACLVEQEGIEAFGFAGEGVASFHDLKQATGLLSAAYYGWPSNRLETVAVTGTNGKTSTTWWLAQALSALPTNQQHQCGLIGTFGSGIPDFSAPISTDADDVVAGVRATGLTTPDSVSIQQSLRSFVDSGVRYCAIEASSIGIQEQRLQGLQIHSAIFTNLSQDHLDYHGTMQAYWLAKRELFDWTGLKAAVINVDDEYGIELANELVRRPVTLDVWTFSCKTSARLVAENIRPTSRGLSMDVVENSERYTLDLPLIGDYNAANLLGVIGALRSLGVPLRQAIAACRGLSPVPGRMDCQGTAGEPLVVVDYAHTPDALEKAMTSLRPYVHLSSGALTCIFGCGGDRDTGKRPAMGAIASRLADKIVITNDNPRSEDPSEIIKHITAGMPQIGACQIEPDRAKAIQQSIMSAQVGDVVLIAGKGHESFQEISGARHPFSDRLCVNAALNQRRKKYLPSGDSQ